MKLHHKLALFSLGLLLAAVLLRFWIEPLAELLPIGYANETLSLMEDQYRESLTSAWQNTQVNNRRVDQSLNSLGGVAILQGSVHVYSDSGALIFESTGLYGVDRRTRLNVSGYGDAERSGQYLFPPHTVPGRVVYWDPLFIGPRTAVYDHTETLGGVRVYVFRFSGTGMDETAGYAYLPDVPERYRALTDGQGTLWIEPVSGIVVDYQEQGVSYFTNPASGERLGDFHTWNGRFTPETRTAQMALARAARQRDLALEAWLPGALGAIGLAGLGVGAWLARRGPTKNRGANQ